MIAIAVRHEHDFHGFYCYQYEHISNFRFFPLFFLSVFSSSSSSSFVSSLVSLSRLLLPLLLPLRSRWFQASRNLYCFFFFSALRSDMDFLSADDCFSMKTNLLETLLRFIGGGSSSMIDWSLEQRLTVLLVNLLNNCLYKRFSELSRLATNIECIDQLMDLLRMPNSMDEILTLISQATSSQVHARIAELLHTLLNVSASSICPCVFVCRERWRRR